MGVVVASMVQTRMLNHRRMEADSLDSNSDHPVAVPTGLTMAHATNVKGFRLESCQAALRDLFSGLWSLLRL